MTKILFFICLSLVFLVGCEEYAPMPDYLAEHLKRYETTSKLVEHNNQFAINKFLNGKWAGTCENIKAEKFVLDFRENNAQVYYWYYTSQPSKDTTFNGDRYEVVDENTLNTPFRKPEDQIPIKIEKLGEDKIRFSGKVTPDCIFTRFKE